MCQASQGKKTLSVDMISSKVLWMVSFLNGTLYCKLHLTDCPLQGNGAELHTRVQVSYWRSPTTEVCKSTRLSTYLLIQANSSNSSMAAFRIVAAGYKQNYRDSREGEKEPTEMTREKGF